MYLKIQMEYFWWGTPIYKEISYIHVDRYSKYRNEENPHTGDPDMIDHFCGLIWGGLCPEPSLGPCADNVIIPLDLTQLFCPGFTLAAGPPSSFTTDGGRLLGGEPCGEPAISLHSPHVSLVQWTTRLQGTQIQIPWGVPLWNRNSPVSIVSLHHAYFNFNGLVWQWITVDAYLLPEKPMPTFKVTFVNNGQLSAFKTQG